MTILDLNYIKPIIINYRDQLIEELIPFVEQEYKPKTANLKYKIATKTALNILIRFFILRSMTELNKELISNNRIEGIVLSKEKYSDNYILNNLLLDSELKIEELVTLKELEITFKNITISNHIQDILSFIYESSQSKEIRKALGQYFTESKYVKMILERIPINLDTTILEPSVGGGSFLTAVINKYKQQNYANENDLINICKKNLYAMDIDSYCANLSKINLLINTNTYENENLNIINGDFLTHDFTQKFDVIIGNPPYNGELTNSIKEFVKEKYPDIALADHQSPGTLNTSALFIRKSIDLLQEGGYLGFVMPNSILRVNSYKKLRNYILETCTIKSIINIGQGFKDVGLEMVLLIIQKKPSNIKVLVSSYEIISEFTEDKIVSDLVDYKYLSRWGTFPVYINNTSGKIANKIEVDTIRLGELVNMPRGYGISTSSPIFKKLYPKTDTNYVPVLRGKDIGQFFVKEPVIYINKKDIHSNNYEKNQSLLVQNVAKRIVSAYSEDKYFILDTINILTIKEGIEDFDYKYLLSILNSELINFYFQNTINNRSKLTIHMDKPYLGKIPIKVSKNKEQIIDKSTKLIELYKSLTETNPRTLSQNKFESFAEFEHLLSTNFIERERMNEQIATVTNELDQLIYQLYNIDEKEQKIIKDNLGTNPIRKKSYEVQLKSFIEEYINFFDQKKQEIFKKYLYKKR